MEITEIRIKLMEGSEDRLRAFCSITIDQSFVVRDLKIIDGTNGPFVAMPSRKLTGHCNRCGGKNHLRAGYCNQCGNKQVASTGGDSPQKLYADVAHPINSECREMIQTAVITEFEAELHRSAQPGYRSRYDDDFDAGDYDEADYASTPPKAATPRPPVQRTRIHSSTHSIPTESPLPKPTNAANDQFGAGLFDSDSPTPSSDGLKLTGDAASDAAVEQGDALLARVESGKPGTAIPAPHRSHETNEKQTVSVPVKRASAPNQAESIEPDTANPPQPEDGFGAGLFDD